MTTKTPTKLSGVTLRVLDTMQGVGEFMTWLGERRPVLGFDLETTGLDWVNGKIRTFQFGDKKTGWVARYDKWAGVLDEVLRKYDAPMTGHNVILFDTMWTRKAGHTLKRPDLLDDTLAMAFAAQPERPNGLKPLCDDFVDPRASVMQQALDAGMHENGWTWETVPWEFKPYQMYSALDGPLASHLWEHFQTSGYHKETYELERTVMLAAADMQWRGLHIDVDHANRLYDELEHTAMSLAERADKEYGVSPSRNAQVIERLLADGVPLTATTPSGAFKLDKEVLEGLEDKHPLARLVLNYRQASKFKKAYVEKALRMRDENDLVHPGISTLGAVTGRMSVNGWPVQQLPAGYRPVRQLVVPRVPGGTLLSVDQSNIEMRTTAHLSGEPALNEAFMLGVDVHQHMAGIVFPGDPKGRKKVKTTNFSKLYGAGPKKLAVQLGSSLAHAQEIIGAYDAEFPAIQEWTEYVADTGRKRYREEGRGYIRLPSGRTLGVKDFDARKGAFYKLVNYAGQGLAAEIMKKALADMYNAGLVEYAIMPVHDEVLLDLPPDVDPADFADAVQEIMNAEAGEVLSVPITTDAEIYPDHWGQCVADVDGSYGKLSKEEWRNREAQ